MRARLRSSNLALILPLSAVFLAGFFLPLATALRFSFNPFSGANGMGDAFTLVHYRDVLLSAYFHSVLAHSLLIAVVVVLCDVVLAYPLALAVTRGPRVLRAPLFVLTLLPLLVSVVVRTFGWEVVLRQSGPVVSALDTLVHHRLALLYNQTGVVIGLAHVLLPFMVLSLVGSLSNVDPNLELASRSLGAGSLRTFALVTLPLTVNGLLAGSVLVFVLALSAFVTPQILGGGKVAVLADVIYEQATGALNWPLASAIGIQLLVLTLAILGIYGALVGRAVRR